MRRDSQSECRCRKSIPDCSVTSTNAVDAVAAPAETFLAARAGGAGALAWASIRTWMLLRASPMTSGFRYSCP
jgi:hypothetical protein